MLEVAFFDWSLCLDPFYNWSHAINSVLTSSLGRNGSLHALCSLLRWVVTLSSSSSSSSIIFKISAYNEHIIVFQEVDYLLARDLNESLYAFEESKKFPISVNFENSSVHIPIDIFIKGDLFFIIFILHHLYSSSSLFFIIFASMVFRRHPVQ